MLKYNKLEKGILENIEDIELLRFIENGIKIKLTDFSTVAVDTPKDLEKVIHILMIKERK